MYEELIAFLLGKKDEFTDDDLDKFIDLLNNALEITEEYDIHKKQSIIENMVNRTRVSDKEERAAITSAIDSILQLDEGDDEVDLFEDKSDDDAPLRTRKFTRGARRGARPGVQTQEAPGGDRGEAASEAKEPAGLGGRDLASKKTKIDKADTGRKKPDQEPSCFVEQEDLLKSDFRTPERPQVKFSELFASGKDALGPAGGGAAGKDSKPCGVSEEFKFDVGELEENHNEGPDFVFNTENSE